MKFGLLLLAFLHTLGGNDGQKLRYALFIADLTGSRFDSSGAVPAIQLAEEMINANSSILAGYNLIHTAVIDTMCDRTISLNKYFDAISPRRPTILGLLGCGCSVASEPVAEIIHYNSISQVSYASPSIELSDRQRFPNFFRAYPSDADLPAAVVALIQKYGWRRVGFIAQEESLLAEILIKALTEAEIDAISRVSSRTELLHDLNDPEVDFFFEKREYRVLILNTDSKTARQIVCEAYLRGFTYPKYAWLTIGWYQLTSSLWIEEANSEPVDCSKYQLTEFLHRLLALEKVPELKAVNAPTDVGLTLSMFDILYEEQLSEEQRNNSFYSPSFVATVAYDALWAFALALNKTNEMVQSLTRTEILRMTQCKGTDERTGRQWDVVPLENFNYSNKLMGCVTRWNLERIDFVGVSGHVSFDDTGSRVLSQVGVYQYRLVDNSINRLAIADIQRVNDTLSVFAYKNNQSNRTVYPDSEGGVPPDGTPVIVVVTFHTALVVTYHMLATAGLVFTSICLIFNFTQRKKKVIRLNSPNLNYFAIFGSYVMNISIFFRVMPSTDLTVNVARCNFGFLLNTIGYCLAYGTILAQMGRIRYIFHDPTANKKTLKDWHLALVVLAITAVGTVLAILQVAVPILRPQPYHASNEEFSNTLRNELGVKVEEMAVFCVSSSQQHPLSFAWLLLILIYLALLQIIGVVLALQTRKVKVKALRNSRYIVTAIFASAIALITIALTTFLAGKRPNVVEVLISGSLILVTAVILSLLFIPKMVSLYKDPKGEHVFERPNYQNNIPDTCVKVNASLIHAEDLTRITELDSTAMEPDIMSQARVEEHRTLGADHPTEEECTMIVNKTGDPSSNEGERLTQMREAAELDTPHLRQYDKNGQTRTCSGDDQRNSVAPASGTLDCQESPHICTCVY